jgi:hypothetical protein
VVAKGETRGDARGEPASPGRNPYQMTSKSLSSSDEARLLMDYINIQENRMGCAGAILGFLLVLAVIFLTYTFFHYEDLMEAVAWGVRAITICIVIALICGTVVALVLIGRMDDPLLRWTNPEKHYRLEQQNTLKRVFGDIPYEELDEASKELHNLITSTFQDKTLERWKPRR